MSPIAIVLLALAAPALALSAVTWMLYPLSVLFELRPRPRVRTDVSVSVIVPAYNEEVVLAGCVESILASGHRKLQVVLVDDGSTDDTLAIMHRYSHDERVHVITKANGGKGSALNAGIAVATGEILLFVDADGLFTPSTIPRMLAGFRHEKVGAVCGNDQPVNVTGPLTGMLALMTHIGTGMTRRALALAGALPIVAGNSGAFRADVVRRLGGFRTDTVGEDLELTWRVQHAGWDVEFAPHARVLAEVPSTVPGLWRQRVRWQRGLIQTARIHAERLGARPRRMIDLYLPVNLLSLLVLPVLQLATLVMLPVAVLTGALTGLGALGAVLWGGTALSVGVAVLALVLDRAWRDLRLLVLLPLWPALSVMMSLVTVTAIWKEASGAASRWDKLERTGVRTVPTTA